MNRTAHIARWLARILSGLIVLFVSFFVIAYFVGGKEHSSRPLSAADYVALATSAVSLAGLVVAWKWELAGGA
ncbi:DUF7670 domain-containing protein, partial [Klebsiella pneumoniae]|uniref:DUF7670 domain-containing protein n=1 Tax=Klebsiella pneumoniae TaxID=573 RepID=UPI003F4E63D7